MKKSSKNMKKSCKLGIDKQFWTLFSFDWTIFIPFVGNIS